MSSAVQLSTETARDAAVGWLLGRINYERTADIPYNERQLKLDRMRQLLTRLGQPDAGMRIVHVAGTKGKGSTSAMIAGMLTAAGFRTGLFTSPHLERIEERFAVDGAPCTAAELVALVDRVRPIVAAMDGEAGVRCSPRRISDPVSGVREAEAAPVADCPTFFEIITAIALLHFVERQVDAAVLEVGLGGRLDSTNVCLPAVSVITSISFDHTQQLGNTLAAIAREKAGIIKPGVPVVSGVTEPEPQAVIAEVAREHGCRLIQLGRDFAVQYDSLCLARQGDTKTGRQGDKETGRQVEDRPWRGDRETRRQGDVELGVSLPRPVFDLSPCLPVSRSPRTGAINFDYSIPGQELQLTAIPLAMLGPHQAVNAAVALAAIAELRQQGWCISTDAIRLGLGRTKVAGRVELIAGEPAVVLDVCHNAASARALIAALAELPTPSCRTLILSISRDKDVQAIAAELVGHFKRVIVTQYQENPRAVPASELADIASEFSKNRRISPAAAPGAGTISGVAPGAKSSYSLPPEFVVRRTPAEAWAFASSTAVPGELVCVAGSFFLAAELRPIVRGRA